MERPEVADRKSMDRDNADNPAGEKQQRPVHYFSEVIRLTIASVTSRGLLALCALILVRYMSTAGFSTITLSISVVTMCSMILSGSLGRLFILQRRCVVCNEDSTSYLIVQLSSVVMMCLVLAPLSYWVGSSYVLVVVVLIAQGLYDFTITNLQHRQRFGAYACADLLQSCSLSILCFVYVTIFQAITAPVFLAFQCLSLVAVFGVFGTSCLCRESMADVHRAAQMARDVVSGDQSRLLGYFLLVAFLGQVEIWTLAVLSGEEQVATYGVAGRYYGLLLLALGAVHTILLPRVQGISSSDDLERLFKGHYIGVGAFSCIALCCIVYAPLTMPVVDAGRYPESVVVFQVLALSAVVSFAFSPYVNILFRLDDSRFLVWLAVVMTLLHTLVCAALVSLFDAKGAALANLLCYTLFTGSIFVRSRWLAWTYWRKPEL